MADLPNADDQTATAPSAENEIQENTPGDGEAVEGSQPQPSLEGSPVESGFKRRLDRQSEKIRKLSEELEVWKSRASRLAETDARYFGGQPTGALPTPPQNANQYPQQEVEQAISTLKEHGMVTKEELNEVITRMRWDALHRANEEEVNRNPNLPKYNRDEVEEYAREKGISDPMAAYRDMYFDDILDSMKRTGNAPRSKKTSVATERPSKPVDNAREPLTLEGFREKLNGPDGQKFYEELAKDPAKFDSILKQLAE